MPDLPLFPRVSHIATGCILILSHEKNGMIVYESCDEFLKRCEIWLTPAHPPGLFGKMYCKYVVEFSSVQVQP